MKRKCSTTRESFFLETQIGSYTKKLEKERLIGAKLDAELAILHADLSYKQALRCSNGRADVSFSLAERRLRVRIEQLSELTVRNDVLRAEIDTMRVTMRQAKVYIDNTASQITIISQEAEKLRLKRSLHSRENHLYQLQIRSLSVSMDRSNSPKSSLSNTVPNQIRRKVVNFTPVPMLDMPLKGVYQHLINLWRERVVSQRQALARHQDYISKLEKGFGRVKDCTPVEFVKLVIDWYHRDVSLRETLCVFHDEIASLETSILENQGSIQTLKEIQKSQLICNFKEILSSTPCLSQLLNDSSVTISADFTFSALQSLAQIHSKEKYNIGKVAAIRASSVLDGFHACWPPLTNLYSILADSGFGLKPIGKCSIEELKQLTIDELIEGLITLIYELDLAIGRLAGLMRCTGKLQKYDLDLIEKRAPQLLFITATVTEDPGTAHVLSREEFQDRAAAKVSLPI